MTGQQAQDWSNYWQGRTAGESGAALVGVGIENDVGIQAFWDAELASFDKDAAILDLACGAGSVIRLADAAGFTNLTGADISEGAISTLKEACPNATGVVTPADKTPFEDGQFDLVVSQFGFEYAGAAATLPEIGRILAPGGQFIALSHKSGSAIETEVSEKGAEAAAILETGFIETAKALFTADKSGAGDAEFSEALRGFRPAQDKLLSIAKSSGGLAAHLYSGTQTLFEKRHNYHLEDITGWLDGMDGEISAYQGRMESMIKAALSQDDMNALEQASQASGLIFSKPEPMISDTDGAELGWIIRLSKPGGS